MFKVFRRLPESLWSKVTVALLLQWCLRSVLPDVPCVRRPFHSRWVKYKFSPACVFWRLLWYSFLGVHLPTSGRFLLPTQWTVTPNRTPELSLFAAPQILVQPSRPKWESVDFFSPQEKCLWLHLQFFSFSLYLALWHVSFLFCIIPWGLQATSQ